MRLARATFALAVGLFLAAIATPFPREQKQVVVPLDLDGVEAVVVESDGHVHIGLDSRKPAQAESRMFGEVSVRAVRRGNTLFVSQTGAAEAPAPVWLTLPPTLARIDLASGTLEVAEYDRLARLEVTTRGSLEFSGDADVLQVVSDGTDKGCLGQYCPGVSIQAGVINELHVVSTGNLVALEQPATLGRVRLVLGPGAQLRLGATDRLDHIVIERVPGQADATPPEASE